MFPTLEPAEIERVRRFGTIRFYGTGEALARVGEVGPGLSIILPCPFTADLSAPCFGEHPVAEPRRQKN